MKIVWLKTGDFIELEVLNHDLMNFLVSTWETNNLNNFYNLTKVESKNLLSELHDNLAKTNDLLINFFNITDLNLSASLDQNDLNLIHEKWVMLFAKYPNIGKLLEKKQSNAEFHIKDINTKIHQLEESFSITVDNKVYAPITNKFGDSIISFNTSNIFVNYTNLGRYTYNKWHNYDRSFKNIDHNDFVEIHGNLNINLFRPQTLNPSKEYTDWCTANKLYPTGIRINLANFVNLEDNLTNYRELFIRNFSDINNQLKFID